MPRGKLRFFDFYKWGGVIGRDIGKMTLFEFASAIRGWAESQGIKRRSADPITDDRLAELGIAGF